MCVCVLAVNGPVGAPRSSQSHRGSRDVRGNDGQASDPVATVGLPVRVARYIPEIHIWRKDDGHDWETGGNEAVSNSFPSAV